MAVRSRRSRRRAPAASRSRSRCTSSTGDTHAAARVHRQARPGRGVHRRSATRRSRGWSARFDVLVGDEPDEDLALARGAAWRSRYWFSGDLERAAERAELALDIAEPHAYPKPLTRALRAEGGHRQQPWTPRGGGGAAHARARDRARARPDRRGEHLPTSGSPTAASSATRTPTHSATSTRRSRSRGGRQPAAGVGGPRRADVPAAHARPLGRGGRDRAPSSRRSRSTPAGRAEPAPVGRRDPHPARRARRRSRRAADVLTPRGVQRRPGAIDSLRRARRAAPRRGATHGGARRRRGDDRASRAPSASPRSAPSRASSRRSRRRSRSASRRKVEELLGSIEAVPPGSRPPYLDAQARRFRARLAQRRARVTRPRPGVPRARICPSGSRSRCSSTASRLVDQGQPSEAEPLLAEATEIFERLAATPWLERARRLASTDAVRV